LPSARFDGSNSPHRKQRVAAVLETLAATGAARAGDMDGRTLYVVPR
jgi:hypothetical protein